MLKSTQMRNRFTFGVFLSFGILGSMVAVFILWRYVPASHPVMSTTSTVEQRLTWTKNYVTNHMLPDGSVLYDYDAVSNHAIGGTYNAATVRDAGISYVSALLFEYDHDAAMKSVAEKYADTFFSNSRSIAQNPTGENAIVYSALSILGEEDPVWNRAHASAMKLVLDQILVEQLPSGAFAESATDTKVNPYYTGEALLALSYALDAQTANTVKTLIKEAVIKTYASINAGVIEPQDAKSLYMWLNRGTVRLLASPDFSAMEKSSFVQAAQKIHTETMNDILPIDPHANSCIWGEGIGQYLLLDTSTTTDSALWHSLQKIVTDNLVLQATSTSPQSNSINNGGFAPEYGAVTARIDYTQHCIGMLITYETLLKEKSPQNGDY